MIMRDLHHSHHLTIIFTTHHHHNPLNPKPITHHPHSSTQSRRHSGPSQGRWPRQEDGCGALLPQALPEARSDLLAVALLPEWLAELRRQERQAQLLRRRPAQLSPMGDEPQTPRQRYHLRAAHPESNQSSSWKPAILAEGKAVQLERELCTRSGPTSSKHCAGHRL